MLESGLFSDDAVQRRRKETGLKRRREASHVPKELRIPTFFPSFYLLQEDVLSFQGTRWTKTKGEIMRDKGLRGNQCGEEGQNSRHQGERTDRFRTRSSIWGRWEKVQWWWKLGNMGKVGGKSKGKRSTGKFFDAPPHSWSQSTAPDYPALTGRRIVHQRIPSYEDTMEAYPVPHRE